MRIATAQAGGAAIEEVERAYGAHLDDPDAHRALALRLAAANHYVRARHAQRPHNSDKHGA